MLAHDSMPELADAKARIANLERQRLEDHANFERQRLEDLNRVTDQFHAIKEELSNILVEVKKTNGRVTALENSEKLSSILLSWLKSLGLVAAGAIASQLVRLVELRWGA